MYSSERLSGRPTLLPLTGGEAVRCRGLLGDPFSSSSLWTGVTETEQTIE